MTDLSKLKALEAQATPVQWVTSPDSIDAECLYVYRKGAFDQYRIYALRNDAQLIAALRNNAKALIAVVEAAKAFHIATNSGNVEEILSADALLAAAIAALESANETKD
jgi:hypothetical protein